MFLPKHSTIVAILLYATIPRSRPIDMSKDQPQMIFFAIRVFVRQDPGREPENAHLVNARTCTPQLDRR